MQDPDEALQREVVALRERVRQLEAEHDQRERFVRAAIATLEAAG